MDNLRLEPPSATTHRAVKAGARVHVRAAEAKLAPFGDVLAADRGTRADPPRADDAAKARLARDAGEMPAKRDIATSRETPTGLEFALDLSPGLPTPSIPTPGQPLSLTQTPLGGPIDPAAEAALASSGAASGTGLSAPVGVEPGDADAPEIVSDFAAILDGPASAPPAPAPADFVAPAKAADASSVIAPTASSQPAQAPVPLGAVPMTIALRSLQDTNRFDIRLDPVELGRIDVRLDIDKERGTVTADLVVDRPATLALLQRDASTLQQALSQAGLDASGGISLSLRDGGGSRGQGDAAGSGRPAPASERPQAEPSEIIDPSPWRGVRLSGIDIRI